MREPRTEFGGAGPERKERPKLRTQRDVSRFDVGEYQDVEVPGLQLRVRATGKRTFELRYWMPSTKRQPKLKVGDANVMTLEEARRAARKALAGVWSGGDPRRELRHTGGIMVGDLVDRMIAKRKISAKTREEWERMAKVDLAPLRSREAEKLRRSEINAWGSTIARRAPYVANRAFAMLRRGFSWGNETGLLETSPFVGLKRPFKKEKKSKRRLSENEIRALIGAIEQIAAGEPGAHLAEQLLLIFLTGVRAESAEEARKRHFFRLDQPESAEWRVPPEFQKLREEDRHEAPDHVVPLCRQAIAIVNRRLEATRGADILFPRMIAGRRNKRATAWRNWSFTKRIREAMDQRLQKPARRWTTHNLRHTITTVMEDVLGIPPRVTDAILAHKTKRQDEDDVSESHAIYSSATHLVARRDAHQTFADWIDSIRRAPMRFEDR